MHCIETVTKIECPILMNTRNKSKLSLLIIDKNNVKNDIYELKLLLFDCNAIQIIIQGN